MREIINLLKFDNEIQYICVAYYNEANNAILYGWKSKIIIMSPGFDIQFHDQYEYFLYSFDFFDILLSHAIIHQKCFNVHIKFNCGMNRLGFLPSEINSLIELLLKNDKYIKVVGVCTHLPGLNYFFTEEISDQISLFNFLVKKIKNKFGDNLLIHPFSSKGINLINDTKADCNMVRVGGALYGLLNFEQKKKLLMASESANINQIMILKAKIIMIQDIKKDEYVGYGYQYKAKKDKKIAIVSFGYGYGYSISLIQSPVSAFCNNEPLAFFGIIGMNALFFDISYKKNNIRVGDFVVLTSDIYIDINAAHLSNKYIGGREYAFTTLLHESIKKIII
jgi:alanine racemase